MKRLTKTVMLRLPAVLALAGVYCGSAAAQAPIVVDTAVPIIVQAVKPKPKASKYAKFQGTVMHANAAQITVRGIENELAVRTFSLSQPLSEKMVQIIERGGYQYGDKVTIVFDPVTQQAVKIKGKPSKPS
ncbi:MAG: hypothetical protein LAN84_02525 [Acidobacteriia bacterium]|nr:hypothetical protein [Terriglobia bacterium]